MSNSKPVRGALTGAGNHRHFNNKLYELVNSKKRRSAPTSMVLLDLDHFKRLNDIHGHAAGDEALYQAKRAGRNTTRIAA